jgi:RimJ/RimL family protein N-acetyltransferase
MTISDTLIAAGISSGQSISIRHVLPSDLTTIANYAYTVSITEPQDDPSRLLEIYGETGFWQPDAGAVAIIENSTSKLVGTSQYFRSGPCIHGLEIGYIIHDKANRLQGYASQALQLLSDHLFASQEGVYRQQLTIETWKTPSWKVAERWGFLREGIMRSSGFGAGDPPDSFIYSRTQKEYASQQSGSI